MFCFPFNYAKMARFCSFAPSLLLWRGRGIIVHFIFFKTVAIVSLGLKNVDWTWESRWSLFLP